MLSVARPGVVRCNRVRDGPPPLGRRPSGSAATQLPSAGGRSCVRRSPTISATDGAGRARLVDAGIASAREPDRIVDNHDASGPTTERARFWRNPTTLRPSCGTWSLSSYERFAVIWRPRAVGVPPAANRAPSAMSRGASRSRAEASIGPPVLSTRSCVARVHAGRSCVAVTPLITEASGRLLADPLRRRFALLTRASCVAQLRCGCAGESSPTRRGTQRSQARRARARSRSQQRAALAARAQCQMDLSPRYSH